MTIPYVDLRVTLEYVLPHPVEHLWDDPQFEAWGALLLEVESDGHQHIILDVHWNLDIFARWLIENPGSLCQETLNIVGETTHPNESIAQALDRMVGKDFGELEEAEYEWDKAIWDYRYRHNLYFAVDGIILPAIMLGCNQGFGEISLALPDEVWAYRFDMQSFLRRLISALVGFLQDWSTRTERADARIRAEQLIDGLQKYPIEDCCVPDDGSL